MESVVSVLIPCRNEERYIEQCLRSVLAFSLPAALRTEILVLDGRSTDRTREIVEHIARCENGVTLIDNVGITQSSALNLGIDRSVGDWILRIDAHASYPRDYLKTCYETAIRTGAANVGGICITYPGDDSLGAGLVQALTTHRFGVGNSGFRIGASEGPRDTVPFGFFRREIFAQVGKFEPRLIRNQDFEFNSRLRSAGLVVWLNPEISCAYYNQRTVTGFLRKQLLAEGPYNAYCWYLAPYAFVWRHAVTPIFVLGLIVGACLSLVSPGALAVYYCTVLLYCVLALGSAVQQAVRYRRCSYAVVLPGLFFSYHCIHGIGVVIGLVRLLTKTAPVQRKCGSCASENRPHVKPNVSV